MAKFKHLITIRFGSAFNDLTIKGEGTIELPPATGFKYPYELDRKDARKFLSEAGRIVCNHMGIVERPKPQRRAA